MIAERIKEYLEINAIDTSYIFIYKADPGGEKNAIVSVPVWVVHDATLLNSGVAYVWDSFEIFTKDTYSSIDEWLQKHYKGRLINIHINHFHPAYVAGWDLRRKKNEFSRATDG